MATVEAVPIGSECSRGGVCRGMPEEKNHVQCARKCKVIRSARTPLFSRKKRTPHQVTSNLLLGTRKWGDLVEREQSDRDSMNKQCFVMVPNLEGWTEKPR
jgi:hypothetical protein